MNNNTSELIRAVFKYPYGCLRLQVNHPYEVINLELYEARLKQIKEGANRG